MNEDLTMTSPRRSIFPWVFVALAAFAATGSVFWINQKIEVLQAAQIAPRQDPSLVMRQTIAALQQTTEEVRDAQQKLNEQVADLQRKITAEQGERKLLSDQLGSISGRVDTLASSKAEANPPVTPPQKNRRNR